MSKNVPSHRQVYTSQFLKPLHRCIPIHPQSSVFLLGQQNGSATSFDHFFSSAVYILPQTKNTHTRMWFSFAPIGKRTWNFELARNCEYDERNRVGLGIKKALTVKLSGPRKRANFLMCLMCGNGREVWTKPWKVLQ